MAAHKEKNDCESMQEDYSEQSAVEKDLMGDIMENIMGTAMEGYSLDDDVLLQKPVGKEDPVSDRGNEHDVTEESSSKQNGIQDKDPVQENLTEKCVVSERTVEETLENTNCEGKEHDVTQVEGRRTMRKRKQSVARRSERKRTSIQGNLSDIFETEIFENYIEKEHDVMQVEERRTTRKRKQSNARRSERKNSSVQEDLSENVKNFTGEKEDVIQGEEIPTPSKEKELNARSVKKRKKSSLQERVFEDVEESCIGKSSETDEGLECFLEGESLAHKENDCVQENNRSLRNSKRRSQFDVTVTNVDIVDKDMNTDESCAGDDVTETSVDIVDKDMNTDESCDGDETECISNEDSCVSCMEITDVIKHEIEENSINADDSGVEFILHAVRPFLFAPLTSELRNDLCSQLQIVNEHEGDDSQAFSEMEEITKTCPVRADNDSFFRALSYAISGTENNHRKIRLAVVKHIQAKDREFKPFIEQCYSDVQQYVHETSMRYLGVQATEVEMYGAADLLLTDIYIFHDGWSQFSCLEIGRRSPSKRGIYLKCSVQSHYEVVLRMGNEEESGDSELKSSEETSNPETTSISVEMSCDVSDSCDKDSNTMSDSTSQERETTKRTRKKSSRLNKSEYHAKKRKAAFERYWNDENYRLKKLKGAREWYLMNGGCKKQKVIKNSQNNELDGELGSEQVNMTIHQSSELEIEVSKKAKSGRYWEDDDYRLAKLKLARERYQSNKEYREKRKNYLKVRYHSDEKHREKVLLYNKMKYEMSKKCKRGKPKGNSKKCKGDKFTSEDATQKGKEAIKDADHQEEENPIEKMSEKAQEMEENPN